MQTYQAGVQAQAQCPRSLVFLVPNEELCGQRLLPQVCSRWTMRCARIASTTVRVTRRFLPFRWLQLLCQDWTRSLITSSVHATGQVPPCHWPSSPMLLAKFPHATGQVPPCHSAVHRHKELHSKPTTLHFLFSELVSHSAAGRVYRTASMLRILHTPRKPTTLHFLLFELVSHSLSN